MVTFDAVGLVIDGKLLGCATDVSVDISKEVISAACTRPALPGSPRWKKSKAGTASWSGSFSGLVQLDAEDADKVGFKELLDQVCESQDEVELYFVQYINNADALDGTAIWKKGSAVLSGISFSGSHDGHFTYSGNFTGSDGLVNVVVGDDIAGILQ